MTTLVSYHLRRLGFETTTARDGETALKLALAGKYDVILLDLMLPMVSGLEICRRLRVAERVSAPIIVVTAVSPPIVYRLREKLGIAEVIFKPFKSETLVRSVMTAVGSLVKA